MKKILLIFTFVLALGLVACSKETTVTCVGNDMEVEWTWNENTGFVKLVTDGVVESQSVVSQANVLIEESEFQTIEEFMKNFKLTIESQGFVCD